MTSKEAGDICRKRYQNWTAYLQSFPATPVVGVAFGHDRAAGEWIVTVVEDVTDELLIEILEHVVRLVRAGKRKP